MFAACSVSEGKLRETYRRNAFPHFDEEEARFYDEIYGSIAQRYPRIVNASPKQMEPKNLQYKHAPFHDVESFFWVLLYRLVLARPKGDDEVMSMEADQLLDCLAQHEFGKVTDGRPNLLTSAFDDVVEKYLSPRLQVLAPMLSAIREYISVEWTRWQSCRLPADHAHEAVKRILLKYIRKLSREGDVDFEKGERERPNRMFAVPQNYNSAALALQSSPSKASRSGSRQSKQLPIQIAALQSHGPPMDQRVVDAGQDDEQISDGTSSRAMTRKRKDGPIRESVVNVSDSVSSKRSLHSSKEDRALVLPVAAAHLTRQAVSQSTEAQASRSSARIRASRSQPKLRQASDDSLRSRRSSSGLSRHSSKSKLNAASGSARRKRQA